MTCLGSPFFLPYFFATQKSQQRNRNTLTVSVSLCDLQQQKSGVLYPNPSSKSAILARSCVKIQQDFGVQGTGEILGLQGTAVFPLPQLLVGLGQQLLGGWEQQVFHIEDEG